MSKCSGCSGCPSKSSCSSNTCKPKLVGKYSSFTGSGSSEQEIITIKNALKSLLNKDYIQFPLQDDSVIPLNLLAEVGTEEYFKQWKEWLNITYPSFKQINFVSYTKNDRDSTHTCIIKNCKLKEFFFTEKTTKECLESIFEIFINAEVGVKRMHLALVDAKKRNRNDLVIRFNNMLYLLLAVAGDYSEVIGK